jgi:hypothetical protein
MPPRFPKGNSARSSALDYWQEIDTTFSGTVNKKLLSIKDILGPTRLIHY